MSSNKTKGKHLAFCALFCTLICVGAKIQIPTYLTPITLQMPAVLLCLLILPKPHSIITIAVYIFAGLIGLPFFSSGGGFAYILNPSFGYLLGFLIATLTCNLLFKGQDYKNLLFKCLTVLITVHVIGTFYTYFISRFYLVNGLTFFEALIYSSVIFLPTDLIWCFICPLVAKRILKQITL